MTRRGRPGLSIGTYGKIRTTGAGNELVARARYKDTDGEVRPVTRKGQTKGQAEANLKEALRDRRRTSGVDGITSETTVTHLAETWLADGLARGEWASNTYETYAGTVRTAIKPTFGGVRIRELRPSLINHGLAKINTASGPSAAKTAKTVLAGMCLTAIAQEALDANPVRDTLRIPRPKKDAVRALTIEEADDLMDRLRSDEKDRAEGRDLPDLVEFMLATGARIGETFAAREASLDLEVGTWEINATVIRRRGVGLVIQHRPKTAAGWRVLALPPFAVQMVRRRMETWPRFQGPDGVIFSSPRANELRDKSNTSKHLRETLDRLGYGWVTSHTFRKTVATRMDEAGMSARQIADQLGHAKPSMTQDVYMGRNVVSAEAARILDR